MTMLVPRKHGRRVPAVRGVRPFSWDLGEFDRLFDDVWRGFGLEPWGTAERHVAFQPRVDIDETDAEYRITAELPGLEEKDFEVSLEGDVLTIKGEKRDEREEKREGYRHVETLSGSFERRFQLPAEVDAEAVAAKFDKGVLILTLPKSAAAKARTIPISAS
jgi:HSP20 family protein